MSTPVGAGTARTEIGGEGLDVALTVRRSTENALERTSVLITMELSPSPRQCWELGHATATKPLLVALLAPTFVPCTTPSELHFPLLHVAANGAVWAIASVLISVPISNRNAPREGVITRDGEVEVQIEFNPRQGDGRYSSPTPSHVELEPQASEVNIPPLVIGDSLGSGRRWGTDQDFEARTAIAGSTSPAVPSSVPPPTRHVEAVGQAIVIPMNARPFGCGSGVAALHTPAVSVHAYVPNCLPMTDGMPNPIAVQADSLAHARDSGMMKPVGPTAPFERTEALAHVPPDSTASIAANELGFGYRPSATQ